jgi:hypothetical protein
MTRGEIRWYTFRGLNTEVLLTEEDGMPATCTFGDSGEIYRSSEDAVDIRLRAGQKPGGRAEALTLRACGGSSLGLVAKRVLVVSPQNR